MKTIHLLISLTYDDEIMYSDEESERWFFDDILMRNSLFLHSNELGDVVGEVKVLPMFGGSYENK